MHRLFLLFGALCVTHCGTFSYVPVHTLAVRVAPAHDANNWYSPIMVRVLEGSGIAYADHWADAVYVYFYYDGISPAEWDRMGFQDAQRHCVWAMRNIPNVTEDQERSCGWALLSMRYAELAPDPRDQSIQ